MLFVPKKTKFLKHHKGKTFIKIANKVSNILLSKGSIGLKSLEFGNLSSKQVLTLKQTLNKYIKKKGRIFINIFPHQSITRKATKSRMGKGKGKVDFYAVKVKPGTCICEIESLNLALSKKALSAVKIKLPFKTKIIHEHFYYD